MSRAPRHTIHGEHVHCGWDRSLPPVHTVAPGDTVELQVVDASGGQIVPESTVAAVAALDSARVNPVTGPIAVDGARPGDALVVEMLHFAPSGWGWTANIPGFGLLADDFPGPALHHWRYEDDAVTPALFGPGGHVPLRPFAGTIGVAPAEPGRHSVIPPRRVGGNMDTRDLTAGSTLFLPVEVDGALFSLGDTHAVQGDGEVCGTALESPIDVTVRLSLVRGGAPSFPRFETPGPATRHLDGLGHHVTTGIGPDLMQNARDAVRAMIDLLGAEYRLDPLDAYLLCSVCADLRIAEIVDAPNWVVTFHFPKVVFA